VRLEGSRYLLRPVVIGASLKGMSKKNVLHR
jgi:hypothetical protein